MLGEEDVTADNPNKLYTTTVKCIEAGEVMAINKDDFLKLKNQHVWAYLVKQNNLKM